LFIPSLEFSDLNNNGGMNNINLTASIKKS
jgi:hypothetical protein